MENNRNFFITIALSVLILTLWQVFYMNPKMEQQREQARIEQQRVEAQKKEAQGTNPGAAGTPAPAPGAIPTAPGGETVTVESRDQAVAATKRIKIDTPSLEGSINLTGARLDDLKLKHYTETVDKNSPEIQL
ncbi:MAG: membrane protein insertase YidC, partial [Mesorhizobium sp.]